MVGIQTPAFRQRLKACEGLRPATAASMQTIHGCAVDTERARHLGDGFAGGDPVHCLPTLVGESFFGRPKRTPRALARSRPSPVRARISAPLESLDEKSYQAPRVHHPSRRRGGGLAARGEGAAARDAGDQMRVGALVIGADAFLNTRFEQLAALTTRYAVPAIYQVREFAAAGGLMLRRGTVGQPSGMSRPAHLGDLPPLAGKGRCPR
jgi:hypothetical protein